MKLSRFLHDKNSREFLYYRKKVAEIRKEAQKLQGSSQKGKWVEGVGRSWEVCGQPILHVETGFWEAVIHGVVPVAQVCAILGNWGHAGCPPHEWSEVRKNVRVKVKVIVKFKSSALCMYRGQRDRVVAYWFLVI